MGTVRLKFCETSKFHPPILRRLFDSRFDISETDNDPDFVIYSVGDEFLDYPNAVRIFFTTENVRPDFNLCDYAFGFDWLTLQDRHYRCPNYQLYNEFKDIEARRYSLNTSATGRQFCNFIYSNGNAHPIRDEFFRRLSDYKRVDSAGSHLNNTGLAAGPAYVGDWHGQKTEFQKRYKFSIAFENSSSVGYTTEKIVHALAADTIPIYWGNPDVAKEFNPARFINLHDFSSIDDAIQRVEEIDQNDSEFSRILSEPYFNGNEFPEYLTDRSLLDAFEHIFNQPKEACFRRNRHAWGRIYEDRRIAHVNAMKKLAG